MLCTHIENILNSKFEFEMCRKGALTEKGQLIEKLNNDAEKETTTKKTASQ